MAPARVDSLSHQHYNEPMIVCLFIYQLLDIWEQCPNNVQSVETLFSCMNIAAMNIYLQILMWHMYSFHLDIYLGLQLLNHMVTFY